MKTNNSLDKIKIIDSGALNGEFYFRSLLEQAHEKELLNDSDLERLQVECLELLAKKTESYNDGFSSSIRVEKAQSLMVSILYTIGLQLKTYPNPDDATSALKNESVAEFYWRGRERIDGMLASTKTVYAKLIHELAGIKNVFYRSTIKGGISGFFKVYYPDFAAQEIHITADYPTFTPMPKLVGIEFIRAYVNKLYFENLFCGFFAPDDIHHLMCGYREDYQELLINLFEPVLTAAIGCVLVKTDPRRLDLTQAGVGSLCRRFAEIQKHEIVGYTRKAAQELTRLFGLSHGLEQYIQSCLPLIAEKIEAAAREQQLNRVFFVPDFPENKPVIIYSFGEKMADEKYRSVIKRIAMCNSSEEKAAIVKADIRSLADLEEVLLDADLTGEEMAEVLGGVGLPEIAALSKRYENKTDHEEVELKEQEQFLKGCLQEFISKMSRNQRELIEKAMEVIKIKED